MQLRQSPLKIIPTHGHLRLGCRARTALRLPAAQASHGRCVLFRGHRHSVSRISQAIPTPSSAMARTPGWHRTRTTSYRETGLAVARMPSHVRMYHTSPYIRALGSPRILSGCSFREGRNLHTSPPAPSEGGQTTSATGSPCTWPSPTTVWMPRVGTDGT